MTDFQVLLATIYVAIIVPFNASFPDTFDSKFCDALANVTSSSSDAQSLFASNETSPTSFGEIFRDDDQKKRFVVLDVIVETIFIVGKKAKRQMQCDQMARLFGPFQEWQFAQ